MEVLGTEPANSQLVVRADYSAKEADMQKNTRVFLVWELDKKEV